MNSLLERQLRKHVGGSASIPDEWKRFVEAVEHAYNQFDDDRKMLERSLDLSSAELCQANAQMRAVFESERHRLDEALRRLRDQHTLILYSIGDGVHGIDRDGNIIIENPAAAKLLGYETDELVGKPAHETVHHHWAQGGAHAKEDCPLFTTLRDGGARRVKDDVFWRKDGTSFPVDYTSTALRGEGGEIIGATVVFTDITERKEAEAEIARMNQQLMDVSRQAGMAEVATSVLHNIGNVLNSVNVSCAVISDKVRQSPIKSVSKSAALLQEHAEDLGAFFAMNPAGNKLPNYLGKLANLLSEEQAEVLEELQSLAQNIEHIKDIVSVQQSFAKNIGGVRETLPIESVVEDALRMNAGALEHERIEVLREFNPVPPVPMEKHKVLQILINLVRNAKHALADGGGGEKQLVIRIAGDDDHVRVSLKDNGIGIAVKDQTRIFAHGFTTREGGHGFGLHSGVLAAQEMGGNLTAQSGGPGMGATFTLELPLSSNGNGRA